MENSRDLTEKKAMAHWFTESLITRQVMSIWVNDVVHPIKFRLADAIYHDVDN